jgi:glycosyltransferase involved in cell wall biosynthesis
LRWRFRAYGSFAIRGGAARLDIFGTGKAEQKLRALVEELRLGDSVRFRGWLDNNRIPEVLAETDVGIVPHRRCGHWDTTIPNKLFDYMAAGRPVLVSDTPPMKRIVGATNCGLIFTDDNAVDFARQLERLASAGLRTELGRRGRKAIEDEWNWSQDGARLVAALDIVTHHTKR